VHCLLVLGLILKRVLGRKKIKEYKDIPNYTALFYKKIFLEWLLDLDRIFYYSSVSEDERVRVTTFTLKLIMLQIGGINYNSL
jgi:hypothetical protein